MMATTAFTAGGFQLTTMCTLVLVLASAFGGSATTLAVEEQPDASSLLVMSEVVATCR